MHSTGLQYSIVHNDVGQPLLHVQVPEGLDGRELGITYDQAADGSVSIVLEGSDNSELGSIACPGYFVPEDVSAKYSGKHKRFTISLQKLAAAAVANGAAPGGQDTLDQRPPAPDTTGSTGEDGSASEEGEEEEQEDAVCQSGADQPGEEGEAKKGKKRRGQKKKKKKTKGKAAAEGSDGTAAAGSGEQSLGPGTPDSSAANNAAGPASANGHARPGSPDSDSTDAFVDACSEPDEPEEEASPRQQRQPPAGQEAGGQQQPSRAQSLKQEAEVQPVQHRGTPLPLPEGVAPVGVFVQEAQGSSALGLQEEPPAAPLSGPVVKSSFTRHEVKGKGEDKVLVEPHATWTPSDWPASTPVSAFGVFDGHGGKMSSVHAAKHILPTAARLWDHALPAAASPALNEEQADAVAAAAEGQGVEEDTALTWAAQDALVERLPQSLHAAFVLMDKECRGKFKKSGTTATLAVSVGWELVVANVGDSCAYLDTGAEVVQLTCNHRVAENAEERARILAEGGELSRSTVDGKEVGPLRVWPGGLAMSRTLGDAEAGDIVPGAPAVVQVTLPSTGARLVIASDGVWDVLDPKNAIHTLRTLPATAADKKLAAMAFGSKSNKAGLRDDITALVVDFLVSQEDKLPRGFRKPASSTAAPVAVETLQLFRPLAATHSTSWRERNAARRQAAVAEALAAAERAAAEEEAAARAAAAAAAAEVSDGGAALSDTYRELLHVRVDVEAIAQELSAEAAAAEQQGEEDGEGWTTVGGSHGGADSPQEGVVPDLEQQMRELAARYQAEGGDTHTSQQQHQEEGQRRPRRERGERSERGGRGRGGREGRRQGRGGGRWQEADHHQQQQQQQHPESAALAGGQGIDLSADSAAAANAAAAAASAGLGVEGGRRGMRREGGRGGRGSRRRSEPGAAAEGAGDTSAQAAGADGWAGSGAADGPGVVSANWEAAPGGGRGRGGRGRGRGGRDGPPGGGRHSGRGAGHRGEWGGGEVSEPHHPEEGHYPHQQQQQQRRGYPMGPRPAHPHQEQQQQYRHADFRGGSNQRFHPREGAAAAGAEGGRSHHPPPQPQQQEGPVVRVVPRPKTDFNRPPRHMGEAQEGQERPPRQEGFPGGDREQQPGSYQGGGRGGRGGYGGRGRGGSLGGRGGGRGPRPGGAEGAARQPQGAPAAP